MDNHELLKAFQPKHEFFTGVDSDGCVFDSMEVKQKEFFIPLALEHFHLSPVSEIVRKVWEFINLYSINRGGNRFISIIKVFDRLADNKDIIASGIELPDMNGLKKWVAIESKLSNENLQKYLAVHNDPGLKKILRWSEEVSFEINSHLRKIPPFEHVTKALELISVSSDIMVVSQTPFDAIDREWKEHGLTRYAGFIAGQEHGTKTEHLALGAVGKYDSDKILMIGDAKGDLDAAQNNKVLFFPIIPGNEDLSWQELINKGFNKFLSGTFTGSYQDVLVKEFLASLPEG